MKDGSMAIRTVLVAALPVFLAACSTTPPPTTAAVSGTAAASATASLPPVVTEGSSSSSGGGSSSSAVQAESIDKELVRKGYKPTEHDGQLFYCKTELTPDRFPVHRCYTAEQIRQSEREANSELDHLHMPGVCTGFGCR